MGMRVLLFLGLLVAGAWRVAADHDAGGTTVWLESFGKVVNAGGNPKSLTDCLDEVTSATGWSGERVSAPAHSTNEVQIGTGKAHGWLVTPEFAAGERLSFVMRAKRYPADGEGRTCPVYLLKGATTGAVWSVTLKNDYRDHVVPLPTLTGGERICVHSMTNNLQGRVLVCAMRLVLDAVPPEDEDDPAVDTASVGLGPVSVKACAASRGYAWREDFATWTNIMKKTTLKDGRCGNWWFEKNDAPAPEIGRTEGRSTVGMIYVGYTNGVAESASLASLTSEDAGFRYGLSFTNDTGRVLDGFALGFTPVSWKTTKNAKTLAFAYAVASASGTEPVWLPETALDVTTAASADGATLAGYRRGERRRAGLDVVLPPGALLHLRWTDPACASAPIHGLDDLELVCVPRRRQSVIRVR